LDSEFPDRHVPVGPVRLTVEGLTRGSAVRGVSFSVRAGEILAITGLVGSGRTETVRLLFGADRRDRGSIVMDGLELRLAHPRDAIRAGIGLLTEDRKAQGLVLGQSARANFGLPNLDRFSRAAFVSDAAERRAFGTYIDLLRIKVPGADALVDTLSGGNQQKVVLAKWLERHCEVVMFDEPTRGIDVGTKYEIYLLMNELAAQGKAVIMVSSELPEVLGMADRILVMHDGRITGEIADVERATQEQILTRAIR
ncbi:MAG: sugar ABC transporter ATP-binding protein, partial [Planctomycetes bacterium]|nr:sugar ABC transporter ATP-binding protein [Planctomycetota bacterium]